MSDLNGIWAAVVHHLWISSLFLVPVAIASYLFRDASARVLDTLYSIGLLKLALPLSLIVPWVAMPWRERLVMDAGWVQTVMIAGPRPIDVSAATASSWVTVIWTTIWFVGVAICLVRVVRRSDRRAIHGLLDLPEELAGPLRSALASTGLRARDVRVCSEGSGPYVRGIVRPRVVLPEPFLARLAPEELRAALLHERQHLRRRDTLRFAALELLHAGLWFYPPIWWLNRKVRETAELACDEAVTREGVAVDDFRRSLAHALRLGLDQRAAGVPIGMLGHRGSFLKRRLQRIQSSRRWPMTTTQRASMIGLALAALAVSTIPAGTPKPAEPPVAPAAPAASIAPAAPATRLPRPALPGKHGVTSPKRIPGSTAAPAYPDAARAAKIETRLILQCVIDELGKVGEIEVLSNPSGREEFVESAVAAVSQWRYEPATRDGKPVAAYFTIVVEFSLDSEKAPTDDSV